VAAGLARHAALVGEGGQQLGGGGTADPGRLGELGGGGAWAVGQRAQQRFGRWGGWGGGGC
jgi:hypothetical protein